MDVIVIVIVDVVVVEAVFTVGENALSYQADFLHDDFSWLFIIDPSFGHHLLLDLIFFWNFM